MDEFDAIVVGGGPAGLTAATYLRRFHRNCLVVDGGDSRARRIPQSHNCPGFPYGVSGVDLLQRMRRQARASVRSSKPTGSRKSSRTVNGSSFRDAPADGARGR